MSEADFLRTELTPEELSAEQALRPGRLGEFVG
ncbi:MAG: hypothetical protein RLY29_137, partial [Actinomycetota bacterium]